MTIASFLSASFLTGSLLTLLIPLGLLVIVGSYWAWVARRRGGL